MRIFRTRKSMKGTVHTARKVRVRWDDGREEVCGVPDVVDDVVAFLSGGQRKVMSWEEVEPRGNKPKIRWE